jgi:hypothetical protein
MATLTAQSPTLLRFVTWINRSVALGHRGAHQSRHAGTVGTAKTLLVARSAQSHPGKHRIGAGR